MNLKGKKNMENYLFQTVKINQMEVKNSIYMPAMHLAMCEDFKITDCAVYINDVEDKLTEFYSRRSLLDKLNSEKLLKEIGFNKK